MPLLATENAPFAKVAAMVNVPVLAALWAMVQSWGAFQKGSGESSGPAALPVKESVNWAPSAMARAEPALMMEKSTPGWAVLRALRVCEFFSCILWVYMIL